MSESELRKLIAWIDGALDLLERNKARLTEPQHEVHRTLTSLRAGAVRELLSSGALAPGEPSAS